MFFPSVFLELLQRFRSFKSTNGNIHALCSPLEWDKDVKLLGLHVLIIHFCESLALYFSVVVDISDPDALDAALSWKQDAATSIRHTKHCNTFPAALNSTTEVPRWIFW